MSADPFVHLHVHTEYSMLDGAAKVEALFAEAKRLEMPAVGMTDHGNMFGADEFYQQAKKAGIKPIIGIEAYVAPHSRYHKKPVFWGEAKQRSTDEFGEGGDVSGAGAYTHMTMLAANATGLRNLFTLSSRASMEGQYRKPRCFLPGQEIMTRGGMKRIEDVRVGDEVLTHRGRFRRVTKLMRNHHEGQVYGVRLNGRYGRTTWMTGEHPVLIRDRVGNRSWVEAKNIMGGRPGTGTREVADNWHSWVCLPKVRSDAAAVRSIRTADFVHWTPVDGEPDRFFKLAERTRSGPTKHYATLRSEIELDRDFGYLIGLYVAEGAVDRGSTVQWHFHQDESDLANFCGKLVKLYTGKEVVVRRQLDRAGYKGVSVEVSSSVLAKLLTELCGSGASRKHLPDFVFEAPDEFMRGAFQGVLDGDGSKTRTGVVSLQQTSEQLHWQMRTLAARLQSDFAGCYRHPVLSENHAQSYRANFSPPDGLPHRKTMDDQEYVYKPVSEVVQETYSGDVYNFEVEEDHSYVTDFAVHNCDRELISELSEGIIATTGCPSGEVQTRLRLGQYKEALQAASDYKDIFGAENFFLELMDHGLAIERSVRENLLKIGKELDLKPLATNDSHYVTADQAESHGALLCVQSGKTLDDPTRFKFGGDGYYLKSAEEMREYWDSEVPGAADSTLMIAERVESYEDVWDFKDRMPRVQGKDGMSERDQLAAKIEQFLPSRYPEGASEAVHERIKLELDVLDTKGYCAYFLVVGDVTRWAKSQGIHVGPGRGSAAGSLLAYVLHITNLDPLEHGLIFERFLNPERDSPPDIDLDFDDRRRDEVLQYAINKYGQDKVAQVITFGKIKTKAAIKDAARVHHGQPGFAIADRISKALPPPVAAKDIPLSGIVDQGHERYTEAAEVRSLVETDPSVSQIFDTARGLEGLIRNAGVHACAVILSSQPLMGTVPLWQRDDGSVITGWDYPSCESIGLLKMDFLGLSNLTILGDALESVRVNHDLEVDLSTLSLDDEATYQLLARGDSLGVFQLEGGGMRELLKRMQPTEFGDVVAANALYRPGPMEVNAHMDYADRKNGKKPVEPIHPELEEPLQDILAETYGLIVYQEQIMAIAQRVAAYSLGRADILRRAMGKKKKEVLDQEFEGFREGMLGQGFSEEAINALWTTVLPFAGYAFNKSHAAGYALVAYWTAYLKANYPAEYMAALLTSNGDNKDKMAVYLAECRRMGVRVLSPDVNDSRDNFTAVGADVRFGLSAIRNVGTNVVASICKVREEKGRYTSFTDFLDKSETVVCNKRVIESLIKAGAFDSLGHTRMSLVQHHEAAVDAVIGLKRQQALGQFDLFGAEPGAEENADASPLAHLQFTNEEWPRKQMLSYEREMLGLYVSAHPLDGAERLLAPYQDTNIAELVGGERESGGRGGKEPQVKIAGMISGIQRRINKNGLPWSIVTLEDLDASVEVLFFPKSYEMFSDCLVEDTAIAVKGRINEREGTVSVFASDAVQVDISAAETDPGTSPAFVIKIPAGRVDRSLVSELKRTLQAHSGTVPVEVKLQGPRGITRLALSSDYFVSTENGLQGELKGLLGAGCFEGV